MASQGRKGPVSADDKHIIKEQIRRHVKNQHPSPHKSVGEGVYQYKRRKHDEFNEGGCTCRDGQIADVFYLPKRLGSGGTREDLMMKGGGLSRPLKKFVLARGAREASPWEDQPCLYQESQSE